MQKNENIIGKVIKKYRGYHGYPRRELAEKLNLAEGTIVEYESGKITPPIEKLVKLHKLLDIPFMEFFSDIVPTKGYIAKADEKLIKYKVAEIFERNPELLELVKFYGQHDEELKKDRSLQLIKKMLKVPKNKRKSKYSIIAKIISAE